MNKSLWGNTIVPVVNELEKLVQENRHPGMVVVEVGVWQGDTSMTWLPIVQEEGGRGILIDWFRGNEKENPEPGTGVGFNPDPLVRELRCNDLARRIVESGFDKTAEIWFASSVRAAKELKDESCDIIFIDADHRYSVVKQDIEFYLPKVKPGGILCGHDFGGKIKKVEVKPENLKLGYADGRHWGVDLAVSEIFGDKYSIKERADNVWVWRKPS